MDRTPGYTHVKRSAEPQEAKQPLPKQFLLAEQQNATASYKELQGGGIKGFQKINMQVLNWSS